MPYTSTALSFGRDSVLLKSREMVIASAGVLVSSVGNPELLVKALESRHYDLLLLCHTLSVADCETALSLTAFYAPEAKILVLSAGPKDCCPDNRVERTDTRCGPAALVAKIHSLTSPSPAEFARRMICPNWMDK